VRAKVFHNPNATYGVIQGMDLLQVLGIDVRCSTKTVTWNDMVILFRPSNYFDSAATTLTFLANDDPLDEIEATKAGCKPTTILHSKYEKVDPCFVVQQQKHLIDDQQQELGKLFAKYDKLFSGKLCCYPHRKIHLDVKDGARLPVDRIRCLNTINKCSKMNSLVRLKKESFTENPRHS
jgi:hypothetical protein